MKFSFVVFILFNMGNVFAAGHGDFMMNADSSVPVNDEVGSIINQHALSNEAGLGILRVDPYFADLDGIELNQIKSNNYTLYGGLGFFYCRQEMGVLKITKVVGGGPAYKSSIKAGDLISAVNGVAVSKLSAEDIDAVLQGSPGTVVRLTFQGAGASEVVELTLVSERVLLETVNPMLFEQKIGYLALSKILEQTPVQLKNAFSRLTDKAGGQLNGVILDLRNNLGGSLSSAVQVADMFLEDGKIITSILERSDKIKNLYTASSGDIASGVPIVILINGYTASASELIAGALQDNGRAIVVGSKSYGKDTIQTLHELHDGGAIKLTTARYLTPVGRSVRGIGIQPDLVVDDDSNIFSIATKWFTQNSEPQRKCTFNDLNVTYDPQIKVALDLLSSGMARKSLNNKDFLKKLEPSSH